LATRLLKTCRFNCAWWSELWFFVKFGNTHLYVGLTNYDVHYFEHTWIKNNKKARSVLLHLLLFYSKGWLILLLLASLLWPLQYSTLVNALNWSWMWLVGIRILALETLNRRPIPDSRLLSTYRVLCFWKMPPHTHLYMYFWRGPECLWPVLGV